MIWKTYNELIVHDVSAVLTMSIVWSHLVSIELSYLLKWMRNWTDGFLSLSLLIICRCISIFCWLMCYWEKDSSSIRIDIHCVAKKTPKNITCFPTCINNIWEMEKLLRFLMKKVFRRKKNRCWMVGMVFFLFIYVKHFCFLLIFVIIFNMNLKKKKHL